MDKKQDSKEIDDIIYLFDTIKSPLQIGFLIDKCVKKEHTIAILLKFIDKKYIKIKPIYEGNEIKSYELEKNNLNIFDKEYYQSFIKEQVINEYYVKELAKFKVTISEIYVINRIIFNDNEKVKIKDIKEFYDDKNCIGLETEELKAKYIFTSKLVQKELELFNLINIKYTNIFKFTDLGKKERKKCKEFLKKLKKETFLKEKELVSLFLWGEYLIFGVALGLCKITIKQINDIYNKADKY